MAYAIENTRGEWWIETDGVFGQEQARTIYYDIDDLPETVVDATADGVSVLDIAIQSDHTKPNMFDISYYPDDDSPLNAEKPAAYVREI